MVEKRPRKPNTKFQDSCLRIDEEGRVQYLEDGWIQLHWDETQEMSPEVMKLLFFGSKIRLIWVACPRPEPVLPWLQGIAAETTIFDMENLSWLQALKPDEEKYEKLEFRDVPKSAEIRE
ncbi:unnamed protein product, partial [Mesorhabditis spiculigera]